MFRFRSHVPSQYKVGDRVKFLGGKFLGGLGTVVDAGDAYAEVQVQPDAFNEKCTKPRAMWLWDDEVEPYVAPATGGTVVVKRVFEVVKITRHTIEMDVPEDFDAIRDAVDGGGWTENGKWDEMHDSIERAFHAIKVEELPLSAPISTAYAIEIK
jgi:hypothetical protein